MARAGHWWPATWEHGSGALTSLPAAATSGQWSIHGTANEKIHRIQPGNGKTVRAGERPGPGTNNNIGMINLNGRLGS